MYKRILFLGIILGILLLPIASAKQGDDILNGNRNPVFKNIKFTASDFRITCLKSDIFKVFHPDTKQTYIGYSAADAGDYLDIIAPKNGGSMAIADGDVIMIMRTRP